MSDSAEVERESELEQRERVAPSMGPHAPKPAEHPRLRGQLRIVHLQNHRHVVTEFEPRRRRWHLYRREVPLTRAEDVVEVKRALVLVVLEVTAEHLAARMCGRRGQQGLPASTGCKPRCGGTRPNRRSPSTRPHHGPTLGRITHNGTPP